MTIAVNPTPRGRILLENGTEGWVIKRESAMELVRDLVKLLADNYTPFELPSLGEPRLETLRPVDFAWQAFQAGMSFQEHGHTFGGVANIDHASIAMRTWWNAHPQVKL